MAHSDSSAVVPQRGWRYCTYFDSGYLSRGLTLIDSLRLHGDSASVTVLALDDVAADYLDGVALEGVRVIRIADIEAFEPQLVPLRAERSRAEYIFTLTPHLIRYVTDHEAEPGDVVAYLDADLAFFESGAAVVDVLGAGSVGIIPHRYPARLARRLAKYGTFNVGWLGFRNDAAGRDVLAWYSTATIEWCADTPDNGRYADQGYLDDFPRFPGVTILDSAGFNLAPWNAARHRLLSAPNGRLLVDGEPLVFFHFHGLKPWRNRYVSAHTLYGSRMGRLMREQVYTPYVAQLDANDAMLARAGVRPAAAAKRGVGIRGVLFRLVKLGQNVVSLVQGNTIQR